MASCQFSSQARRTPIRDRSFSFRPTSCALPASSWSPRSTASGDAARAHWRSAPIGHPGKFGDNGSCLDTGERHEDRHRRSRTGRRHAAYAMMMRRIGSEIVLVDRNTDLAVAQARDILDATPLPTPSGSARANGPILPARAWSCLRRGPTRGRGEPSGSAVAQRRDLRRDRAGSVGGGAGADLSGGDQSG